MSTEFTMPKLGLTMEEGTILEWLVEDGSEVTAGSPVLLIETDKTETEVEASASGRLHRVANAGDTLACGEVIGHVLADGEAAPAESSGADAAPATPPPATVDTSGQASEPAAPAPIAAPPTGRLVASPNAKRVAAERGVELSTVAGTGPGGRITSEDILDVAEGRVAARSAPTSANTPSATPATVTARTDVVASIAARNLADLIGVDLNEVAADPAEQRITKAGVAAFARRRLADAHDIVRTGDVVSATAAPATAAAASTSRATSTAPAVPLLQTPSEVIRLAGMRGTIAKRMSASLHDMAQLTLQMDADMGAVAADRARRKEAGDAPGFTDYVVAAAARALRQHPRVNAQVTDDGIALLPAINVGLAVALDEGLVVPVVPNTDALDLQRLGAETTRLATAARSGSLTLPEMEGGTFSVTALGMFGVDGFTPVINPPNVAILGVGRLRDDLMLAPDGSVTTAKRLTLSLTWDHRAFDGAPAAEFTKTIVDLLADPAALD